MNIYPIFSNQEHGSTLHTWWKGLEHRRGERARLRRCSNPHEVALRPAYHELLQALEAHGERIVPKRLVIVAGLCAQVIENVKPSKGGLGAQFGAPASPGSGAPVSNLRFARLLTAETDLELYTQLRRLLPLVNFRVDLVDLANAAYAWSDDIRWSLAHNYYLLAPPSPQSTAP